MRRLLTALALVTVAGCGSGAPTVAPPAPTPTTPATAPATSAAPGATATATATPTGGADGELVTFGRFGAQFPPERETLTVAADGSYTLWRSFAAPSVGRFAGTLDDGELDRLAMLVAAARQETVPPPLAEDTPPDASIEVVELAGTEAEVVAGASLDGAWGALLPTLRQLLDELTDAPAAAVRAQLPDPATLRLEHVGDEPLPLDLSSLLVQVDRHDAGVLAASATESPAGLGAVTAAPGWVLDLPLEAAVSDGPGLVTARATFVAVDDGVNVPVSVTVTR